MPGSAEETSPALICLPPLTCYGCGSTERVQLEPSLTRYPWDGMGTDPNRDLPLCEHCGAEHREYWEERWADYYAGLL